MIDEGRAHHLGKREGRRGKQDRHYGHFQKSTVPCLLRILVLAGDGTEGYTIGMKTAVSIPDDVYERAERLAQRTRRSRSRLFSDALDEYLARHETDEVTAAMNAAVEGIEQGADDFANVAARRVLERVDW